MYNNDGLVELVANSEIFLKMKTPIDKRVLEAMRKVDRKYFLSDEVIELYDVDEKVLGGLYTAWEKIENVETKPNNRIILHGSDSEDYQKPSRVALMMIPLLLKSVVKFNCSISHLAYNDIPLPIGFEQTCSKPSLIAFMNDMLQLEKDYNVLEIGAGCGYHAAITSEMVGQRGKVTTLEIVPELTELAKINLEKHFKGLDSRVVVLNKDGSKGYKENAPYDRIYLTAGVNIEKFNVKYFTDQLNKKNGIFLFPDQKVFHLMKYKEGKLEKKEFGDVNFVRLKGENS